MAADEFDIDQPLINEMGKPTVYFEEQWFLVVEQLAILQNQIEALTARVDAEHPP